MYLKSGETGMNISSKDAKDLKKTITSEVTYELLFIRHGRE